MLPLTIEEVLNAAGGRLASGDLPAGIAGVSTDTRTLKAGDLYIPISGDRFDGHDFIGEAFRKGAAASFISKKISTDSLTGPVIEVGDALLAYQALAAFYRRKLGVKVVAVTGSAGKTTTKELIGAILEKKFSTVKSEENFNNEIGVPRTIFKLEPKDEVAVLEMAMRGREQIRPLARLARPDIGVITNIGEAHYELLGSIKAIADAKGELLEEMDKDAVAVLNADDGWLSYLRGKTNCRVLSFGESAGSDVRLEDAESLNLGGYRLRVSFPSRTGCFDFPLLGRHNIKNALAALAVGEIFGLGLPEMAEALSDAVPGWKRMERRVLPGGINLLLDCYNANPGAVRQALDTLAALQADGKKVAVLGDMLELGEITQQAHLDTGGYAALSGIDALYTVGALGELIARGAREAGMSPERIFSFSSNGGAAKALAENLRGGEVVLIKGSRKMKMEEVAEFLSVSVK